MVDRVGQQLGNYRLTRLLGRGGFAEVYLGEHVRLNTHAAVKVLYTRLASPEEVAGFHKEAQTIAHLDHPHIVRVFDFDVVNDTPFLVMSYAAGGTLRQRHPKGTVLPLPTIISYIKQVAYALQYAHDQRLVHRDIKPENLLVGQRDEVLLSDFGIATVAQSSHYQGAQDMAGTIAYMAPEQIQAHPRPASDQYSLGIVVYEWLSGDRPFHGSFTEIAIKHSVVPPPSLREKLPMISPEVEQVVMTALAKDPKQRFGNVRAFAHALEQAYRSGQERSTAPTLLAVTSIPPAMPLAPPTREIPPSGLVPTRQEALNKGRMPSAPVVPQSKRETMVQDTLSRRPPPDFTIICGLVTFIGILEILVGIVGVSTPQGVISLILGILDLVLAWGLSKLQRWALWGLLVLAGLNVIISIVALFTDYNGLGIISIVVWLIVLFAYFRKVQHIGRDS